MKFNIGDEIKTANEEPLTITKIDEKGYWSEDLFICGFDDAAKWELVEKKSSWSEEDETGLTNTIIMLKEGASLHFNKKDITKAVDFLNSLKERVQPQPKQEWSEEDKKMFDYALDMIEWYSGKNFEDKSRLVSDWLKSLRPQITWKPSDEQMKALKEVRDEHWDIDGLDPLYKLYQDLKKLKE